MARFTVLSDEERQNHLSRLPDWRYETPDIKADYVFPDFRTAIAFICVVGIEAEKMDHHPEFFSSYDRVSFQFCTHDAGHQVTDLDTKMAEVLSQVARQFGGKSSGA
jgi:4a-hydroxytetrahydrobiopterin dehydratase